MFNLNRAITRFNRTHLKKIKLNESWNLVYLQPKALAFLNNSWQLIQKSKFYASPFVTNTSLLDAALVRLKEQSNSKALLPSLQDIALKLTEDRQLAQRLDWEKRLADCLNNETIWEQGFMQAENNPWRKSRLVQAHQQWKIHQAFQCHSSQGLLFLLEVVVEYQYHFTQALKELEEKQTAWFSFRSIPGAIAEDYRQFLRAQSNKFKVLEEQVIAALLLRLKVAEQEKQVTNDDVSYFLVQHCQLDLSFSLTCLPKHRMLRDTVTFKNMQRAIEKYGNTQQKKQLYQLAWYQYAEFSRAENMTIIKLSAQRLLIPNILLRFIVKKQYKPPWWFVNNSAHLQFLEAQQALLAQLSLPQNLAKRHLTSLSMRDPDLRLLMTRYQLLQQAFESLAQQPTSWWQWQQKKWKKTWRQWLNRQLLSNQNNLQDLLANFYQQVKNRQDLLRQTEYCQKIQDIIQASQRLLDNDSAEHYYPLLIGRLEDLSVLLRNNAEKKIQTNYCSASMLCFRRDLSAVLDNYVQRYQDQGLAIPKKRTADVDFIREQLHTTKDIVELRENLSHHYRVMWRPRIPKKIPFFDRSVLRRGLRRILENPDYSPEQLQLVKATPGQAKQMHCQLHNSVFVSSVSYSDSVSSSSSGSETSLNLIGGDREATAQKMALARNDGRRHSLSR